MKTKYFTRMLLISLIILSQEMIYAQVEIRIRPGIEDNKDAYVNSLYVYGYSNHQSLIASAWSYYGEFGIGRSFIDFSLPSLPDSITNFSARLDLYYDYSATHVGHYGDNSCVIERIIQPWDENSIDWFNQPEVTTVSSVITSPTLYENQNLIGINVTDLIDDMYEDAQNSYGLRLSLLAENLYRSLILASGDHPDENIRPCLVISYDTCIKPIDRFHFEVEDLHCSFQYNDHSVNSWNWNFGNGYGSYLQNPEYTFADEGTYYVCLEVANSCDTVLICDSVIVCQAILPSFTYLVQDSLHVKFFNQSVGVDDFYWDFGNGYFSFLENPEFLFSEGGKHIVCLSLINECGLSLICDTINLSPSLGFENIELNTDILVYPNPATDVIFVQSGSRKIHRVELYNDLGILEDVYSLSTVGFKYTLPLQNRTSGLYILRLVTEDGCFTKRVIVL
ncbi:DNRLRE domain-containing protein [Lentimicrobium saccharophilum]|nr:DNRLRE domain-containing protein [Lentimicrobium saccharophilum]